MCLVIVDVFGLIVNSVGVGALRIHCLLLLCGFGCCLSCSVLGCGLFGGVCCLRGCLC